MSNYLIELSVIHIALMLGYWLLLRKERQYAKMRFYLIVSTFLALIIPVFKLPKLLFRSQEPIDAIMMEAITPDAVVAIPDADTSIWNSDLWIWIYLGISVFFLFKLFSSVLYLVNLERKSSYEKFNDLYIRKVGNIKGSFTFFNWIFLSDEIDEKQQDYNVILRHEQAHVSLGHTYDLIFFELFKVCFWWLPTTWFIIKEIKKIHEYQADACALKSYNIDQYSSILISSTLKSNGLSLACSFHDGLILKRLIAMKQQAKKVSPWKLGVLSILGASLFIAFACSEEKKDGLNPDNLSDMPEIEGELFTVVEEQPEFEGGMDAFYNYIRKEMKYPLEARRMGIEGRVYVQFVIEKDGSLSEVESVRGIGAGCDREAVRVVENAPSFKPGKQRGKPVRVRMVLPVAFKLNEGKVNDDKSTQGMIIIEEVKPRQGKLKVDASYANGKWSGTIYDEGGEKLPGVNIVVAGTTTGTVSGIDGAFKVKANASDDLVLSFVGYQSVRLEGE